MTKTDPEDEKANNNLSVEEETHIVNQSILSSGSKVPTQMDVMRSAMINLNSRVLSIEKKVQNVEKILAQ